MRKQNIEYIIYEKLAIISKENKCLCGALFSRSFFLQKLEETQALLLEQLRSKII